MLISKKEFIRRIHEADQGGFTRGWEEGGQSGYKLGQHYARDRERINHIRLDRELEEIQQGKEIE